MAAHTYPLVDAGRRLPLPAVDDIRPTPNGFIGRKKVVPDDPYLSGHFPELTVYPGVFLVESLQQMLELHLDGALGGVDLTELRSVRFSRPALAGDVVELDTDITGDRTDLLTHTTCSIDGQRCARITARWRCRT
ncbi:3-hydroxyacyl-ACP dehydratase FabZ family protein [Streptomyces sp. cg35]|uniref:3-hydroxyacyl-ACP dehydratase FabZ family protein n=1 Tax=Streptomyces sp. cg35 TaxID=3421650 RepID=UPI003D16538F